MFSPRLLAPVCALFVSGLVPAAVCNKPHRQNPNVNAFVDVNAVPMDEKRALTAQTVMCVTAALPQSVPRPPSQLRKAHSELTGRGKYLTELQKKAE